MLSSAAMRSACVAALLVFALEGAARADVVPSEAQIDLTKDQKAAPAGAAAASEDPSEAPPAPPYKKSVVLDASVGALGFLGEFGKVAPPGPWMHLQGGYEVLNWLMLYGEGELAFTDTSNKQDPPKTRAFAMFGFGGGARFTIRFTERFGIYAQGGLGAMKADIATHALGILGFRDAEDFDLYLSGRLGAEWYQIDRHFALGVTSGIRLPRGFAKTVGQRDTPLALDGGLSLRYAF
jgi:hypothetical protein